MSFQFWHPPIGKVILPLSFFFSCVLQNKVSQTDLGAAINKHSKRKEQTSSNQKVTSFAFLSKKFVQISKIFYLLTFVLILPNISYCSECGCQGHTPSSSSINLIQWSRLWVLHFTLTENGRCSSFPFRVWWKTRHILLLNGI